MTAPDPDLVVRFRADAGALGPLPERIGIAVSGGPDSLALLILAASAFPGRIAAATVDHRLRPESADEAAMAQGAAAALNVPHSILPITVTPAGEGVQAAARAARYAALGGWMRKDGIGALMTAHHADDQAETLLLRLNRGAGIAGLAGVRARRPLPEGGQDAVLLRPLLGWRRVELAGIAAASGLPVADDPSNRDPAYDRARLRQHLAGADWIDRAAFAHSAAALAESETALAYASDLLFARRVAHEGGDYRLDPADLPAELVRRLVLACIARLVPDARPRGGDVAALIARLATGETATLAGVKCTGGALWTFAPAPPRRSDG